MKALDVIMEKRKQFELSNVNHDFDRLMVNAGNCCTCIVLLNEGMG